ncbi:sensor histidine kinase [Micromonospora psammae]|uniref:sensor histidine kinase n=1 Tax=Micromonospora sp. CPCC 205556 TaxID=3122398 RepID=UPI002FF2CE88
MRSPQGLRAMLLRWRRADRDGRADPALMVRLLCHEFRTPVSTLTSLTRALADDRAGLTDADRRAITELAREQAAHLDGLLRDAAAAGGGGLPLAVRAEPTVPLAEVLPAVAALVPAHRLRTRVTGRAGRCPVPARRIRQVLVNLVQNALWHGPHDGEIGLYAALRRDGLSLLVTDQGRSVAALAEALRRPAPGSGVHGLGLWIVRQLVAVEGGTVRAHRLRPGGVGVEVLLPPGRPRV